MSRTYATTNSQTPPGGSNTNIQYNDGGSFGGDANLTWDKTGQVLKINGVIDDPSNLESIDPVNRELSNPGIGGDGVMIDYANGYLRNPTLPVQQTVDWLNQFLVNGFGVDVLDWRNMQMFDTFGIVSIDWNTRQLLAPDGTTILDWSTDTPVLTGHFADNETPAGTFNGTNTIFTLFNAPSPSGSLQLFLNGQFLSQGTDYTLSGITITFLTAPAALYATLPFIAFYRW